MHRSIRYLIVLALLTPAFAAAVAPPAAPALPGGAGDDCPANAIDALHAATAASRARLTLLRGAPRASLPPEAQEILDDAQQAAADALAQALADADAIVAQAQATAADAAAAGAGALAQAQQAVDDARAEAEARLAQAVDEAQQALADAEAAARATADEAGAAAQRAVDEAAARAQQTLADAEAAALAALDAAQALAEETLAQARDAVEGALGEAESLAHGAYGDATGAAAAASHASPVVPWTSLNDGSGSCLDADTLDGLHASDIMLSVETERAERLAADAALTASIAAESAARAAGDAALAASIAQARADLLAALAAETAARAAADAALAARAGALEGYVNGGAFNGASLSLSGNVSFGGVLHSGVVPWARLGDFPLACPAGQFVVRVGSPHTCASPPASSGGTVTSVGSGFGLTGGPITSAGTLSVDASAIQRRVTGSCPVGMSIRVIAQDGTVVCQPDANSGGTVTQVATGSGLTGGPITSTGTISIATGGVTGAHIADGTITGSDVNSFGGFTLGSLAVRADGSGMIHAGPGSGCGGNYAGLQLNGLGMSGCSNYNFLSSPTDTNLYVNRPAGSNMHFRSSNADQMVLHSDGTLQVHGALNVCPSNYNGCYLRLSDDGHFADFNDGFSTYVGMSSGKGLRLAGSGANLHMLGTVINMRDDDLDTASHFQTPYDMVLNYDRDNDNTAAWFRLINSNTFVNEALRIVDGDNAAAYFDGNVNANGIDVAESFLDGSALQPGELVRIDPANPHRVLRTTGLADPLTLGVVSTAPGLILGAGLPDESELAGMWGVETLALWKVREPALVAQILAERPEVSEPKAREMALHAFHEEALAHVALVGRVPVKADASFGAIRVGDLLMASPVPGVAMRATGEGPTIGIALEPLASGQGKIFVFVQRAAAAGASPSPLLPAGAAEGDVVVLAGVDEAGDILVRLSESAR
ncbi:MAG TPA: hypothetical protein VM582_06510, partial [Candidatus Thermoplasmatota archaeon]|nr:hypothetical protein [Candidatus Thermoplasmatota archaeon]